MGNEGAFSAGRAQPAVEPEGGKRRVPGVNISIERRSCNFVSLRAAARGSSRAAKRRQHLAVGVSPWKSSALVSSRVGGDSKRLRAQSIATR